MLIDLTMPLDEDTPVYPGDPKVEVTVAATVENEGYLDHVLKCGTHNGTHIDAPAHMVAGGRRLNAYGPAQFIGKGAVVDVRVGADVDLSSVESGSIVLLRTDFSIGFRDDDYYEKDPQIGEEVARELVRIGVKMVAVDAGSIDSDPFLIHKTLLGGGVLIAENVVNIGQIPDVPFEVIALPLNVGLEGSPVRIVARTLA